MKNRRYFTCPIQAIYMAKEFGVVYIVGDQAHYSCNDFLSHTFNHLNRREKFYVAEVSESIFEQKKGDIGIRQEDEYIAIAKAQEFEDFEENNGTVSPSRHWKIIMRNNKHFFMGELENEI
jgi:hypothetical protein